MDSAVELDNIQIVEVTGKAHRDRQRHQKKKGCHCNPSLRATTILIFVCIGIVYVIGVAIGNVLMFSSLEYLDQGSSNTSINRLVMLLQDDIVKLQQMVRNYAFTPACVNMVDAMVRNDPHAFDETYSDPNNPSPLYSFIMASLNNTVRYCQFEPFPMPCFDEFGNVVMDYGTSSECNFWAVLDPDFKTLFSFFNPKDPNSPAYASSQRQYPPPAIADSVFKDIVEESGKVVGGWQKMLVPNEHVFEPMLVSIEPILDPFEMAANRISIKDLTKFTDFSELPDGFLHGYLVSGRLLMPRLKLFSDDVPSCITLQNDIFDDSIWDETDKEMFQNAVAGTYGANKSFTGKPSFAKRGNDVLPRRNRICPAVPLFNATSTLMVGYLNLCGLDTKNHALENASCVRMRLDRPMSMVDQGTIPVVSLSLEIIAMMIILCVIFVVFLDCVVLRRIVNLSNVIKKQTHGHAQALKDDDETTATMSVHEDKYEEKRGKSGKSSKAKSGTSASGTSDNSRTTNSSDAGGGPGYHPSGRDEIGNLKRAMEQNAQGLRKRLEAVNDSIKIEQQKTIRHKQAMQLLNLWCGRKDYFPGLRPNAMQLRYEPTRNLDDLLSNPLAIEYLKSHCESDRTLENLWFVLDVSWLEELETAEDNEEDQEKRAQIHEVATCAAKTILQRYIAVNAPQQINISAGTYKKLREKGEHYARHMFDEAVSEVKLMLNTDILPRFQKSAAYSAMSETLFIDSSGDGDESEFSDETVSTAGSILTDDAEEGEGGVAHVFAHTFKNLHTAFEVAHDDNSSTYSGNSSHATNTTTSAVQAGTVTSGSHDKESMKSGTQPPKLEEKPKKEESKKAEKKEEPKKAEKKEEPKKAEKKEEPKKAEKKEEPKKDESEESGNSTDSSSHSISSDSMSQTDSGSSESD